MICLCERNSSNFTGTTRRKWRGWVRGRSARFGFRRTAFGKLPTNAGKDARCLHASGRFEGAVYLCGYVLECFLKFVICETRSKKTMDLSEAKQLGHNLVELLDASNLGAALVRNRDLHVAFTGINDRWAPEMRYSGKPTDRRSSEIFLQDTRDLRNWLQTQLRP